MERTEEEWKETGVAEGAWPVNMYDREFGKKLSQVLQRNTGKRIGFICAVGGRTGYVTGVLEKNGTRGMIDVSEGMLGSPAGKGWIARGLPIVSAKTAMQAIPRNLKAR